jgi:hypothetical protein
MRLPWRCSISTEDGGSATGVLITDKCQGPRGDSTLTFVQPEKHLIDCASVAVGQDYSPLSAACSSLFVARLSLIPEGDYRCQGAVGGADR